ncbi:glycosyltransferase [Clostridium pasteurianum DSM 525 = ATCC 6013]|uniref:Glycosyl transferase group 1 n=1 Tax=Clostridium pasteurianum DSM 525 = ATCC 6013 TaxID=1262449 RepID=A0A0H3J4C9_CLOPA|nr:glycosyltransferase [Clostridium pasteurianum]AJA46768.1 glycosyltransferase [Clostridium pasteurianum DSM 525 = ATCC 6013]AJA50756.1 glycosyltransferase [Clostridium pasteurianum DSM 525 = ATCC 6013]AOZ74161.1 hypothetical protein AQ983_03205 [Clostridium pasteurianum DSM 525 = ATCC 6013]AOZ77959.1 hypothetical protein AQ984_03205 [Clostridium pasteurianum]ELP58622.1 chloramphenicol acetyltransferase [Clostridium pasteurianum DSM 525 = ATCC 6013]
MKVLHYTLGMPPYRTGGLTKYSVDLIKTEKQQGMEVIVLYPGHYNFMNKTYIDFDKKYFGIKVYELVNPLPVSLLGGVGEPDKFIRRVNEKYIYNFLLREKPDIVHIHTLMGLPFELVESAKALDIKTIFTTHDYYGLCPKVNLVNSENVLCENYCDGRECVKCNLNSYSLPLITLMQSKIYRRLKNHNFVKHLRKRKNVQIQSAPLKQDYSSIDLHKSNKYVLLRQYYLNILDNIDFIHYNSTTAEQVYKKYLNKNNGKIINITHNDIKDNRKEKLFNRDYVNFGYVGPISYNKGFFKLYEALEDLHKEGIDNWKLKVYGNKDNGPENPNITYYGSFDYNDLKEIYGDMDVLIIPSMWRETFGFIVLEALSHGVPCIVTDNVGSKDIIEKEKFGLITTPENLSELLEKLIEDKNILADIRRNILSSDFPYTMDTHIREIKEMYINLL